MPGSTQIYDGFIGIVAPTGARFRRAPWPARPKGRVWTGQQAKQIGLVDSLGGLEDAIKVAHDLAGIPADQPTAIVRMSRTCCLRSRRRLPSSRATATSGDVGGALTGLDGPAGTAARALAPLFKGPQGDLVRMPEIGSVR